MCDKKPKICCDDMKENLSYLTVDEYDDVHSLGVYTDSDYGRTNIYTLSKLKFCPWCGKEIELIHNPKNCKMCSNHKELKSGRGFDCIWQGDIIRHTSQTSCDCDGFDNINGKGKK